MRNKPYLTALRGYLLLVLSSTALADNGKLEKHEEAKREMLSTHETIAVFQGLHYRVCRSLTINCPETCGASGEFARFKIVKYLKYEKLGKDGDPKQKFYLIQVTDFHKNPIGEKLGPRISKLKKGDRVVLAWRHDKLTTKGSSGSSVRVVTKLQIRADE